MERSEVRKITSHAQDLRSHCEFKGCRNAPSGIHAVGFPQGAGGDCLAVETASDSGRDVRTLVVSREGPRTPRILVAIPCLNEESTIGSVVLKARQHADEVVVVDDGSTDDTGEVAALAGAHVIRHSRNLGKGLALRSAWLYARELNPEALVVLDGDHQHDPNDIPRIVTPILDDDADVVLGFRWGKTSGMPSYRRVGKRVLDYATSLAVKDGMVTDSQCGYRAFSREAVRAIEPSESGLAIESQMLMDAQEQGLRIQETSIDARYDLGASIETPLRHGTKVLGAIILLVSEKRPLLYFGIGGLLLLVAGAILGIHVVQLFYGKGELAVGYSFLVVLFEVLGILSIFTGIMLNAMRRLAESG